MDNIKQMLCEKIESLINGGDRRCLTLSERYHRHLIKHHSLQSNQAPDTPSRRKILLPLYGKEKSATAVGMDMEEDNFHVDTSIKKEIIDWSSDLPVYYNSKFEELKENVVNELIEIIKNILEDKNITENILDKLEKEISQNIYCIPLTYEQQKHFEAKLLRNLKEIIKGISSKSNLKSIQNLIVYEDKHLIEAENNKYLLQNSYIDMIKNISPALLSDFQLTSFDINSQRSLRTHKITAYETNFEISNYTSTIAKCQNIIRDTALNFRNKLNNSSDSIRLPDIREIQQKGRRYVLGDYLCNFILIYRSEDQNNKTNIFPTTTDKRNQQVVCDVDSIKNELYNWLLEKEPLLKHKTKLNKNNRAIAKIAKTLYDHMSKNVSYSIISKDVDKLTKRFVKPAEYKKDTDILSKELILKLYSLCPKIERTSEKVLANSKTQASICKNIEKDTLECSLKKLLLKYVAVLSEEESLTVKETYRVLFKNKIQSMLNSKLCSKYSVMKDQEEVLSYELKNDIDNIKFIIDWIKTTASKKTISNLEMNSEVLIDIVKILRSKKDSVTDTTMISQKILYKLSRILEPDSKNNADTLVNELLTRYPKHYLCMECYNKNRSDVVDDYFYLHSKEIIKENFHFNAFSKLILREITNHCLCHLCSILIHNDFEYVKEIWKWLDNNLPLLSANGGTNNKKIMNMVAEFVNEIKFNVEQQDDDDSYIKNFIVALPLNRDREIDIQSAALQLKKRVQHVDNILNKSKANCLEEYSSKIDIVTEIENWCESLPFTISDKSTTAVLKQGLALNLLKKIGELNVSFEYNRPNNKTLYEKDVSVEIDTILNNFPLSYTFDDTRQSLQDQLLKKIFDNFDFIKKKSPPERYILQLSNFIELSLRSNASIKTEEDKILIKKITNGLMYLSLLRQFETDDIELQKKYFIFLMEEIFVYITMLQYANTLFIIPFMLGPIEDFTDNVVEYRNHPFIVKKVKIIKTKYMLSNWIDSTLPIQKPNNLQEMVQTYDMLTELTNSVVEIENKYNYDDSQIDAALKKCIEILPLPNSIQEGLYFDFKNVLISTFNERNSIINKTKEHHAFKSNQKNLQPHLIPYQVKNTLQSTRSDATQSSFKIQELETKQWYSLPPDTTAVDNQSTRNDNNIVGKYYTDEQNIHKSSQHELSSIHYDEFGKGAELMSSAMGSSSIKRTNHGIPQTTYQDGSSTANYGEFVKGVEFKSSLTELSPIAQKAKIVDPKENNNDGLTKKQVDSPESVSQMSLHKTSCQLKLKDESNTLNYEDFEKGVNLKSSSTELPQTQKSKTSQIVDLKDVISQGPNKHALTKEQINSSGTGTQGSLHKSSSPMKLELGGKSQKSSQTPTLELMGRFNERPETSEEESVHDTTCKCHKKYLPSYMRRYCKICNSFSLGYPDFHFW